MSLIITSHAQIYVYALENMFTIFPLNINGICTEKLPSARFTHVNKQSPSTICPVMHNASYNFNIIINSTFLNYLTLLLNVPRPTFIEDAAFYCQVSVTKIGFSTISNNSTVKIYNGKETPEQPEAPCVALH